MYEKENNRNRVVTQGKIPGRDVQSSLTAKSIWIRINPGKLQFAVAQASLIFLKRVPDAGSILYV